MRFLVWDLKPERAASWAAWRADWRERAGLGARLLLIGAAALVVTGLAVSALLFLF